MSTWFRLACMLAWLGAAPLAAAGQNDGTGGADAAPPNLALSNVTQNSVYVHWEPIAGATRYELSYGTDADASNRGRTFISGTSQTLTQLMGNTIYRVKVRAVVGGRAGAWSQIQEFSTNIPAISELVTDDIRDTSVHLTWSGMFSDLPDTVYEISYGTDQDATSDGSLSTSKNFLTLHNLMPDTTYFIKLRARNPKIAGPWNTPISVSTLAHTPALAPQNLTISSGSLSAVKAWWDAVPGANSYDIAYGTDALAENLGIVPVYENNFMFQLPPNTRYYFKVRALVKGSTGPWSNIVNYLTLPAAPRGLMVSTLTSQSAVLGWRSLAGANQARYYHVSWGTTPEASNLGVTVTANSEYLFENLRSDQVYYAKIRTLNLTGPSPWSEAVSFKTLPGGFIEPRIQEVKHTTAKIEWPPMDKAVAYELFYSHEEQSLKGTILELTRPPVELKNLKPDCTYYLKLRGLFDNRQPGPWSNIVTFRTFAIPPVPKNQTAAEITGTYARLTWTAVDGISTYEVLVSTDEFDESQPALVSNRPKITAEALRPNTLYFSRLRALNLGGPGPWSERLVFATLPVAAPEKIQLLALTPESCRLSWDLVPGTALTTYEIRYAGNKAPWQTLSNYAAQSLELTKLDSETNYRLQIRAKNQTGFGPWSSELAFTTPPLPPDQAPKNLHGEDITDISAKVVWKPLERAKGYLLSLGTDPDASDRGVEKLDQTEFILKGLIPDTNYFFKVKAYNQSGEGPWSDTLLVSTRPTPPLSAPSGVTVSEIAPTSFRLGWEASSDAQGYEISLGTDARGRNSAVKTATGNGFVCDGLRPNSVYYVKIRKVNRGGSGPWSQMKEVNTAPKTQAEP